MTSIKTSLAIIGPTASGKSRLAIEIAKKIKGEIIGLDSRQIYKDMSIGTAQLNKEEEEGIPHHLIGIKSPAERISAGAYAKLVLDEIKNIQSRNHVPIICGGSGLYFRSLIQGIFKGSKSDYDVRKKLENEYDKLGSHVLIDRLNRIDPDYAISVHPNNKKRLIRALEIYEITGKSPTENFKQQSKKNKSKLKILSIYLEWERKILNDRIKNRTRMMLKAGWIDEVEKLIRKYPNKNLQPLDSIGYREIVLWLNSNRTLDDLEKMIYIKTRQFSVRQIKWFKKESIDFTIKMNNNSSIDKVSNNIIEKIMLSLS
ncbi:MAG: tRNA (adenosine(37)-N6)-dimethylallyltransferase MiaA [Candidatus Neomarinimicrobiota bacterium]|nr:tRNA (adenosine(37)-N6)-dimethylallyltransferase MiaA [Candidatus Neomarinimicrobiota bacterium]